MKKILVKIPTRSRPEKFFAVLDGFIQGESGNNEIRYLISCDLDDDSMNNDEVRTKLASYGEDKVLVFFDERAGKIGSVNRDMDKAPGYDILMQPADDWSVLESNWDDVVVDEFRLNFPDLDGVLWFFDGHNRETDTLCIMGKPYYERFGYIYYPEYRTFWADTEFTAVADLLDRLAFIDRVLFSHDHPDWLFSHGYDGRKSGYDQLYHENDKQEDREWDHSLYHKRLYSKFGLE